MVNEGCQGFPLGEAGAIRSRSIRVRPRRGRATLAIHDPRSTIHDPGGSEIRARCGGTGHGGE